MASGGATLQPTFKGHVATTQDALILFEACLQGHLSHVPRRPLDRERSDLIRSGHVFIYDENASAIKRWTDGITWSPSRILGNFLIYREVDKPFPPGEKKRAKKGQQRHQSRPGEPYGRPECGSPSEGPSRRHPPIEVTEKLIGSLIDSYDFKKDGLVKKTMSVMVQGVKYHLVSYYHVNDALGNLLPKPSQMDNLQYIRPRSELTSGQSFREPAEDVNEADGAHNSHAYPVNTDAYPQPYYIPPMAQQQGPHQYFQAHYPTSTGHIQCPVIATSYIQGQLNAADRQNPYWYHTRDGNWSGLTADNMSLLRFQT
ncbi:uncharacterized protein PV07_12656 [Cladophialophora immunda]|uniref:Gti1/Pac2 family protein n=1 Tax=Cladophialophora immunda TaxID=569365 RepID=A0A0D2CEG8_9EURO|nr:uncharacterized protein PV07_12656 [Cladophialophora immunda]KIW21934.1 hypothetical protein PV07_12656 [Cladophialophora immunda]